ncbi:MAG TPA: hypothetical protein VNM92_12815 [Thermoanaerobaculia bacterium]|nr:hypothetical protein [Thermoanaerobaculia bacterium]
MILAADGHCAKRRAFEPIRDLDEVAGVAMEAKPNRHLVILEWVPCADAIAGIYLQHRAANVPPPVWLSTTFHAEGQYAIVWNYKRARSVFH